MSNIPAERQKIATAKSLVAWRNKFGLMQTEAAALFCRSRRAYQYLEAGDVKKFPQIIDVLCALYEKNHKPVKKAATT